MSDTSTHSPDSAGSGKRPSKKKDKPGLFGRVSLFLREVVAELRKVIWPTRKELITYTGIVIVFVVVMAAIIAALDFVFTQAVLTIFGD